MQHHNAISILEKPISNIFNQHDPTKQANANMQQTHTICTIVNLVSRLEIKRVGLNWCPPGPIIYKSSIQVLLWLIEYIALVLHVWVIFIEHI